MAVGAIGVEVAQCGLGDLVAGDGETVLGGSGEEIGVYVRLLNG